MRFPHHAQPRASIVIIAWKQLDPLVDCMRSLHTTLTASVPHEIIIVSNDASQGIKDAVRRRTEGIRLVEAQANLGFAGGCNLGASIARGDYVVLLNDDAVVAPGWLDWLVATADANPSAGAVGSVVLFPDGPIQEAGSIIWNDGSTMPVGRYLAGNSLAWQFVRPIDFASGCSLLVRKSAWDEVGGLDVNYHPAYYEDVDLCLALRERGYRVLLEPRSRVWHHESASSDDRFKRFLFGRNQVRLYDKWKAVLALQEPAAPLSEAARTRAVWRARGAPARVLAIDDRVPDPSLGSGFGRMFDAVIEMGRAGYAVSLCPMLRQGTPSTLDALVSAGVAVIDEDLDVHLSRPWVCYDFVVVSRPHNFERVADAVRRRQPQAVLAYDCEALFWRRIQRHAQLAPSAAERASLESAAEQMRVVEEAIVRTADCAVTVSREEAELLARVDGCCPIRPLLPTEPAVTVSEQAFHDRSGIGYVAGWLAGPEAPNADGLRWFVAQVLPRVVEAVPWVSLFVTGTNPPEDLLNLASPNVSFTGHVASLAGFYGARKVIISPIRFGAGVKIKTVQALQYGVPVVATTCGAEGIDQKGVEAIDVTDDPATFAKLLVILLTDETAWTARRRSIAELVASWQQDTTTGSWTEVVADALARRVGGRHALHG